MRAKPSTVLEHARVSLCAFYADHLQASHTCHEIGTDVEVMGEMVRIDRRETGG